MPGDKDAGFSRVRLRPFDESDDARALGASVIGRAAMTPVAGGHFDGLLLVHAGGYGAVYWRRANDGTGAFRVVPVEAVEVARASCSCGALVDAGPLGHMPWCRRRGRGHVRLAVQEPAVRADADSGYPLVADIVRRELQAVLADANETRPCSCCSSDVAHEEFVARLRARLAGWER